MLTGVKTLALFKDRLNLNLGEVSEKPITNLSLGDGFWSAVPTHNCAVYGDEVLALSAYREDEEDKNKCYPIAAAKSVGKGKVIMIGTDIGAASETHMTVTARKIIEKLFNFYTPTAKLSATQSFNITLPLIIAFIYLIP